MISTTSTSSNASVTQSCVHNTTPQRTSSNSVGSQGTACSTDSSTSRVARPRLSRGSCHTPVPRRSSSSSDSSSSSTIFADYDSGVVFSGGLYTASGERITTHEFETKPQRVMAPTLYIVIPDTSSSNSDLPSFALTVPTPISPNHPSSPVLPPAAPAFTRESYLAAAASAPPSSRVPNLPQQRCPHPQSRFQRNRCCSLCELQQLACEIWLDSRRSMLCAPHVPPAVITPRMRAVHYALGLPLGRLDPTCIDVDDVIAISIMRRPKRVRGSCSRVSNDTGIKSKPAVVTRAPSPARRMLGVFVRRARHVLSAPTRVPMMRTNVVPRRRVVLRS